MKGMIIWAQSNCRSTMGLYEALIKQLGVPVTIALWLCNKDESYIDKRTAIGFSRGEFSSVPMVPVGDDYEKGIKIMDEHPGCVHLFTVFQASEVWRRLISEAKRRREKIVIACESPCNMDHGIRKLIKELYLRAVLPVKGRKVISAAECFVNYSGFDDKYARIIGWSKERIIPFGYFPPPIPNSHCVRRRTNKPFRILATGVLSKHRGADILVEALRLLKMRGVAYRATITQKGELLEELRAKAERFKLPIDFCGFVEMPELIHLYETCSVYVGAGRHEPWGMRLNDALQCGAPLVVSQGMGGCRMVDDYGCGLTFVNEDPNSLAGQLERLATDDALYSQCAENAILAADACSPSRKASELIEELRTRFPKWAE